MCNDERVVVEWAIASIPRMASRIERDTDWTLDSTGSTREGVIETISSNPVELHVCPYHMQEGMLTESKRKQNRLNQKTGKRAFHRGRAHLANQASQTLIILFPIASQHV